MMEVVAELGQTKAEAVVRPHKRQAKEDETVPKMQDTIAG